MARTGLLRIKTLGQPAVTHDGRELPNVMQQTIRGALLIYLAVERVAARDTLVSMFWPDREPDRAKRLLSQMMYELKRVLGEQWFMTVGERIRIAESIETDAVAFEQHVNAGRAAEAIELYSGHFLEGFRVPGSNAFDVWIDRRRANLSRLHRRARRQRISELVQQHELYGALRVARAWVELDPLKMKPSIARSSCSI